MAAEELADLERLDAKLKAMKSELSRGPGLKLTLDGHPRMRPRRCRADHPSQSPLYIPRSPHRSPGAPRLARRRGPPPRARHGGGMGAAGRRGLRAHSHRVDRPFQARAAGRLMERAAGDETKVAEMTDTTRRRFLQYGMAAGAALAVPAAARLSSAAALTGGPLKKFREPLPVPGKGIVVATPSGTNPYSFTLHEISRKLHPALPPPPVWAYDDGSGLAGQAGSFGMVIAGQSGTPIDVSYTSHLPETYPDWIPVDTRLTPLGNEVRTMAHLHGGFVAADSDGNPAVTPDGFGHGQTQHVHYTNALPEMPASLRWFHD